MKTFKIQRVYCCYSESVKPTYKDIWGGMKVHVANDDGKPFCGAISNSDLWHYSFNLGKGEYDSDCPKTGVTGEIIHSDFLIEITRERVEEFVSCQRCVKKLLKMKTDIEYTDL